nr:nucleolar protein 8 isoform X2 [Doryrhamphus excisus]XP_057911692.1 nucleolar protein 8 isoform X2 [Doryrhamphus excisus]
MQRLYVGGLSHTITQKDLKDRFGKFGGVEDVEIRTRRDDEGIPYKTFAYVNINISDTDLKKCMTVLNKSKWKGGTLQIEPAKESFLHRLALEREMELQLPNQSAAENHKQKVLDSFSKAGVNDFTMKAAVPGTEIPGHKDWVVSKFGRVLPIMQLTHRKGNKSRTLKYDPSKYSHNIRKLAPPDEDLHTPVAQLTWEVDGGDDDISKKRRGEFPPYEPPRTKKSRTDVATPVSTSRQAQPHQLTNGFKAPLNHRQPQKNGPRYEDSDVDSDEDLKHLVALQQPSHHAMEADSQEDILEVVGYDYLDLQKQQQHGGRSVNEDEDYDSADTDEIFASRKPYLPAVEKPPQPNPDNIPEREAVRMKNVKMKSPYGEERDTSGKTQCSQQTQKQTLSCRSDEDDEDEMDSDDSDDSDYEAMFSNVTHLEISMSDLQKLAEEFQETSETPTPSIAPAKVTPGKGLPSKKGILPEDILASLMKEDNSRDEQKPKRKTLLPAFQGTRTLTDTCHMTKSTRILETPDLKHMSESESAESDEEDKTFRTKEEKEERRPKASQPNQTSSSFPEDDVSHLDEEEESEEEEEEESEEEEEEEECKVLGHLQLSAQKEEERQKKDNTRRLAAVQQRQKEPEEQKKLIQGALASSSFPEDDVSHLEEPEEESEEEEEEEESEEEEEEEESEVFCHLQLSAQEEEEQQKKANTRSLAAVQQRQKEPEEQKKLIQGALASSSFPEDDVSHLEESEEESEEEEEEEQEDQSKVFCHLQLSAEEEEERQKKANTRRLAAVQQRQKEAEEQKKLIQGALANVDTLPKRTGKHVVFDSDGDDDDDDDDEQTEVMASKKSLLQDSQSEAVASDSEDKSAGDSGPMKAKEHPKQSGPQLFSSSEDEEDDDEEDDETRFDLRPQFEGQAGQKLMELQSRFGTDERFRMDSRFLEEEEVENDDNKEELEGTTGPVNDDEALQEERKRTISILYNVLGQQPATGKTASKAKTFRDVSALHYDPSKEEHATFETKTDVPKKESKSARRKKKEEAQKLPEVSKEIYYDVTGDLKAMFGQTKDNKESEEVKTNWDQVEEDVEAGEDEEQPTPLTSLFSDASAGREEPSGFSFSFFGNDTEAESEKTAEYKVESIRAAKVPWQQDPRLQDSSSEEDEEEEEDDEKEEEKNTSAPKNNQVETAPRKDLFFFHLNDIRLLEGPRWFCRSSQLEEEREQWEERRMALKEEYHKKHKDACRKLKSSQKS